MGKIRVAVVGAGNMGKNHIRNYLKNDAVELVAISDPIERAEEIIDSKITRHYSNCDEMFDRELIDAVSIVVPTPLHYKIAAQAISRGIHTLLEKPIASTIPQANKLTQLAKKRSIVFTVGHIERYNPIVNKLHKVISSNRLGEVSSVVCRRVGGFPAAQPATDVVLDLAIHDVDIISHLMQRQPKLLAVHGSRTFHSSEVDSAEILLSYNGASGFIQSNWVTPTKIRSIAVTGSNGYVEANYITQEMTLYEHMAAKKSRGFKEFVKSLGSPKTFVVSDDLQEPLKNEINEFIKAIKTGKHSALVSPTEATEALKTALQISRRLQKGK